MGVRIRISVIGLIMSQLWSDQNFPPSLHTLHTCTVVYGFLDALSSSIRATMRAWRQGGRAVVSIRQLTVGGWVFKCECFVFATAPHLVCIRCQLQLVTFSRRLQLRMNSMWTDP